MISSLHARLNKLNENHLIIDSAALKPFGLESVLSPFPEQIISLKEVSISELETTISGDARFTVKGEISEDWVVKDLAFDSIQFQTVTLSFTEKTDATSTMTLEGKAIIPYKDVDIHYISDLSEQGYLRDQLDADT